MTRLVELVCGDEPVAWARLGFAVEDGDLVRVGPVAVRLTGAGGGLTGWRLAGFDGAGGGPPDSVDGIATAWTGGGDPRVGPDPVAHPNGALALDHVVLMTGDRDRSAAAVVAAGGDERRRAGPPEVPVAMAFVRLGEAVVEVAEGGGPARLWGLVAVVEDLDALAATLGTDVLGDARPAVQPGRRIAAVRAGAGLGTQVAFMTPRVRTRSG